MHKYIPCESDCLGCDCLFSLDNAGCCWGFETLLLLFDDDETLELFKFWICLLGAPVAIAVLGTAWAVIWE